MASTMRRLVSAAGLAVALISTAAQVQAQEGAVNANRSAASAATEATAPAVVPVPLPAPDAAPRISAAGSGAGGADDALMPLPRPDETNAERARTQPRNNAPFWRGVRQSGHEAGTVNNMLRGERGVLIQRFTDLPGTNWATAGEVWRQMRNQWIVPYGGALLVITCLALALFYFTKGKIVVHDPPTGRLIERFTYFERAAHWVNAVAFVLLALSGIFMAFGKAIILPVVGHVLFGWLTYALKTLHNFVGPMFAVSLAVMFFAYLRDNWPRWDDVKWLLKGGGFFTGQHIPSHRFNAGEKIVFWGGVLGLGSIVVASGFVLDRIVPGMAYTRNTMQIAHIVHAVATVLMMAMITAHAYLGTIGMEGAYRAMRTGYVDETWAREHHEYWWRDIKAGKIPAQRSGRPIPQAVAVEQPVPQH